MTVSTVTLTRTYSTSTVETGVKQDGYIEVWPNAARFTNDGKLVLAAATTAQLSNSGAVSVTLVRCPSGYVVTEYLGGKQPRRYVVPDQAGPVDLSAY